MSTEFNRDTPSGTYLFRRDYDGMTWLIEHDRERLMFRRIGCHDWRYAGELYYRGSVEPTTATSLQTRCPV